MITATALALTLLASTAAAPADRVEAERADGAGHVVRDRTASGGRALELTGRGAARVRIAGAGRLVVVARARRCAGSPKLALAVDGRRVTERVRARGWGALSARPALAAGTHALTLRLRNPHRGGGCRRAVLVDALRVVPADRWVPGAVDDVAVAAQRARSTSRSRRRCTTSTCSRRRPRRSTRIHAARRRAVCYLSAGSYEQVPARRRRLPRRRARQAARGLAGRALARHPAPRRARPDHGAPDGPLPRQGLRRASSPTTSTATPTAAASRCAAATSSPTTACSPRAAHARGLSIGLKNDLDQVAALRARLRLGAERAVLPVRRVRAARAVHARRQGGVRGRVRARAVGVLRAGAGGRADGDAQAPRPRRLRATPAGIL